MLRTDSDDDILLRAPKPKAKPKPKQQTRGKHEDNLTNRDPNSLNPHVKITFLNVFGEPERGPKTFEFVWELSGLCFNAMSSCMYKLYGLLCGVCVAIYLGCAFVPVIFSQIWICTPRINLCTLIIDIWCKSCCYILTRSCISPFTRTVGLLLSNVRYSTAIGQKDSTDNKEEARQKKRKERMEAKAKAAAQEESAKASKGGAKSGTKGGAKVAPTAVFSSDEKEKVAKSIGRSLQMYN